MTGVGERLPPHPKDDTIRRRSSIVLGVLACLAANPSFAAGTYYVDRASPKCSNSGAGTEAQPYCTISAAVNARGGPATTILVKPGVYHEQFSISTSGGTGGDFEIRAVSGGVVVDGADDFSDPGQWVQLSGDVWLAASVSWEPKQVFADGARLAVSAASPDLLPSRTFRWVSGAGLYVNAGGGSPAGHQTRVGRRNYGFTANGKTWVTIDGFAINRTEDRLLQRGKEGIHRGHRGDQQVRTGGCPQRPIDAYGGS